MNYFRITRHLLDIPSKDGTGGKLSNYINQYHSDALERMHGFYTQIKGPNKLREPDKLRKSELTELSCEQILPQGH